MRPNAIAVDDASVLREVRRGPSAAARLWRTVRRQPVGTISLLISLLLVFLAIFAGVISPYDPLVQDYSSVLQPPSAAHVFGTDNLGRDLFSRIVFGARISLVVGISAVAISTVFGTVIGLASGFFRGR